MKPAEIRELTDEQLDSNLNSFRAEIFNLRRQAKTGQLENSARIRLLRKDIARIETEKTARAKKND